MSTLTATSVGEIQFQDDDYDKNGRLLKKSALHHRLDREITLIESDSDLLLAQAIRQAAILRDMKLFLSSHQFSFVQIESEPGRI
jgi:hypothetical protein